MDGNRSVVLDIIPVEFSPSEAVSIIVGKLDGNNVGLIRSSVDPGVDQPASIPNVASSESVVDIAISVDIVWGRFW